MSAAGAVVSDTEQSAETLARWTWCGVIFSLLGVQILISGVAVFLATSDPSNVIVEGYYEQALSWDEHRLTQAKSDSLGWKSKVIFEKSPGLLEKPRLEIALLDASRQPVAACQMEGELFHHARAGDVYKVRFVETRPGHYAALVPIQQPGLWELSLVAAGTAGSFQEKQQFVLKDSGEFQKVESVSDSISKVKK
ncbi:MAG: FixH family protein [Planctomycetaceae bacterium]|nr:FixH family protein [Planctomycetaceae bacterium]